MKPSTSQWGVWFCKESTSENQLAVFVWQEFSFLYSLGTWFSPGNIFNFNSPYSHYSHIMERQWVHSGMQGKIPVWNTLIPPLPSPKPSFDPTCLTEHFPPGIWSTHSRSFSELHCFFGEENLLPPVTRSLYPTPSCSGCSSFPPALGSSQQVGPEGHVWQRTGNLFLPFSTVKRSSFPSLP